MLNTETLLFILRVGNINLYQTGGQLLEPSTVFEEFIRRSKGRLSLYFCAQRPAYAARPACPHVFSPFVFSNSKVETSYFKEFRLFQDAILFCLNLQRVIHVFFKTIIAYIVYNLW